MTLEFTRHFTNKMLAISFHCESLRKRMERVIRPSDWRLNTARFVWMALVKWQRVYRTYPTVEALSEFVEYHAGQEAGLELDDVCCIISPLDRQALTDLLSIIAQLPSQIAEAEAPYYAERLRSYIEYVRLCEVEVRGDSTKARAMVEDLAATMKEIADAFENDTERYPVSSLYDGDCLIEDQKDRVPLGIPELDKVLGGGIGIGEIALVMASTGVGKTNALLHSATCAGYQGNAGLFLSLELGRKVIAQRGIAMAACVPASYFRTKPDARDPKYDAAVASVLAPDYLYRDHLSLVEMTDRCPSVKDIEEKIVEWKARLVSCNHAPEFGRLVALDWLEYVDYTRYMGRDKGSSGMAAALQKVLQELRQVAQRQQVAIITATQLNREAEGRELANLKYASHSYAMTNVCDLVLTLCPKDALSYGERQLPQPLDSDDTTNCFQQMNMQIAKIRNAHGRNSVIELTRAPSLAFCGDEYTFQQAREFVVARDWEKLANLIGSIGQEPFKHARRLR